MAGEMMKYDAAIEEMDKIVSTGALSALASESVGTQLGLARSMGRLRRCLSADGVMADVMELQGSAVGFCTDKDRNGGYPMEVVRDCLIEAMLRGLRPVNNEFNIISGRMYAAKNGLARLVARHPDVCDFVQNQPEILRMEDGKRSALVRVSATWKRNGRPESLDASVPVNLNAGMGPDAVLGKARRKCYALVLERLGFPVADGEADDSPVETSFTETKPTPADSGAKLAAKAAKADPKPAPAKPTADSRVAAIMEAPEIHLVASLMHYADAEARRLSTAERPVIAPVMWGRLGLPLTDSDFVETEILPGGAREQRTCPTATPDDWAALRAAACKLSGFSVPEVSK